MQVIVFIVMLATATSLSAETLSFPSFDIDIPDGWEHSVEADFGRAGGEVITIHKPGSQGSLQITSYEAAVDVAEGQLRNMTNVDASIPLVWQHWGDYAGYQYDYGERQAFYRQWWLVNTRTLVFITWKGDHELRSGDRQDIDGMVRSLTVRLPR